MAAPILVETIHQPQGKTSPRETAVYVRPTGGEMIGFYTGSSDNGATWSRQGVSPGFTAGMTAGWRRVFDCPPWRDPVNNRLLVLLNSMDVVAEGREPNEAFLHSYLRYCVSVDGGKTYLFNDRVIQDGFEYCEHHPLDDVYTGKNGYMQGDLGQVTIRIHNGSILVPIQVSYRGQDGKLECPGGGSNYSYARVLIGVWQPDNRIKWTVGAKIMGDPLRTSRGLMEPTIEQMPNGMVLMLARGSNGWRNDPKFQWPSRRWLSSSRDGGLTWTRPSDWRYEDGGEIFSPSSMSRVIRHSSGRVYWIGNISPRNCQGNNPRCPLVMGEVSSGNLGLIRSSVLTLDDVKPTDTEGLNLSHMWVYEDRGTGYLRVVLRRYNGVYDNVKWHGVEHVVRV